MYFGATRPSTHSVRIDKRPLFAILQAHVYDARFYMFKLPFGPLLMSVYFMLFLLTHPFINHVEGFKIEQVTLQVWVWLEADPC